MPLLRGELTLTQVGRIARHLGPRFEVLEAGGMALLAPDAGDEIPGSPERIRPA